MNHPTRRSFLKASAALAAALPLARLSAAPGAAPAQSATPGADKGLLFDAADLPRIQANTRHPRFSKLWEQMNSADLAADTDFIQHKVRFNNHVADMMRVREVLERSSFVYALTRDPAHLAVARLAYLKIIEYPKWDYFLEGGKQVIGFQRAPEATIAMCLALDWLGDALTPAERAAGEEAIASKGAPACFGSLYGLKYPDRVKGWGFDPDDDYPQQYRVSMARWPLIINSTNLKVIPTCALGMAACALRGKHPQAGQWLELARSSAKSYSTLLGADGSYDEGVSYWGYTLLHLALFAEVLWRKTGIDDRSLINYPGTVRYALAHTMPTKGPGFGGAPTRYTAVPTARFDPAHDIVNYSDALSAIDVSVAAWVSRTHRDPLSQHCALNVGAAKFSYGMIWFDPAAPAAAPVAADLDIRMSNDLVFSRTGWTADDCLVFIRSGGPSNHEHADRNSVIFKAHGERLFHDPFRAGYSYTTPRWKLRLTSAHTSLLIDGQGHQYHDGHDGTNASWAWARVTQYRADARAMVVTSDATEAYSLVNDSVQLADRTLVYLKPDVLLVLDRVRLARPQPVQLRFQVFNDDTLGSATTEGDAFAIVRPSASARARVLGTSAVTCASKRHDLPEEEGVHPFVEAAAVAAPSHDLLTICTAAPTGQSHGALSAERTANGWRVTGTHRGLPVAVSLDVSGATPIVSLA